MIVIIREAKKLDNILVSAGVSRVTEFMFSRTNVYGHRISLDWI